MSPALHAAPGQTAESCAALAADLRERAARQTALAEAITVPGRIEGHTTLAAHFTRQAERLETLAAALARTIR